MTELLGRIWAEYPNGMLDISEAALGDKEADALAVEDEPMDIEVDESKEKGGMMTFDDMGRMRETILTQLK